MYDTYEATIHTFKKRLRKRSYPNAFVNKTIATVKYSNRNTYLQRMQPQRHTRTPPLYKLLPPPQYNLLKQLVLQEYGTLHFMSPRFIALKHPTLQNVLVRSQQRFSDTQFVDVVLSLGSAIPTAHTDTVAIPHLYSSDVSIKACKNSRCNTCKLHLVCSPTFKSNYPQNRTVYHIRHSFSCKSTNVIYLITCSKFKKQYVGCTTTQLNTRISHHRSSINNKRSTYLHKHFNLPDHSITHLKVQPINTTNSQQDLYNLEHFWISTLRTLNPYGLNSSN